MDTSDALPMVSFDLILPGFGLEAHNKIASAFPGQSRKAIEQEWKQL
jgi:hypothetical protein